MTAFVGAVLLIVGVVVLIKLFGLFPRALQAMCTLRSVVSVINDPALGDDHKESLLQGYSLSLLGSFLDLLLRGAGAIAIPIGALWGLEFAGVVSFEAVLAQTLSWPLLLGSILAALVAFWPREK
jgi:hypothetical protein